MSNKLPSSISQNKSYPLPVSISMILVAILLSFVDLTFLNDVIGKILDKGTTESFFVSCALGLVGIVIMAHQGIKVAHGVEKLRHKAGHYILWISLGLAFAMIRLFSASFLQLSGASGDQSLMPFFGINIREVDLVLAPLMFFLYVATGLIVKDGFKNLYLNPEFNSGWIAWKKARHLKKIAEANERKEAERANAKSKADAQDILAKAKANAAEAIANAKDKALQTNIQNAKNGNYDNALAKYKAKENEIKENHQKISANIDNIKNIDKQEENFEKMVKPSLLKIINQSIHSVQSSVALIIANKTSEDINNLKEVMKLHNNNLHD